MTERTPIDLKIVSIFLVFAAFSYFNVNTNINFIFGTTISGTAAEVTWIISCGLCIIGAYGLWSKKLIIWKIIFVYTILCAISSVLNFLLIPPHDRMKVVPLSDIPEKFEPSSDLLFFVFFLFIQIVFVLYLYRRKSLFS